jgi:hypothetical protein
MITVNVTNRIFRIKYKAAYGTCFTVDVEGKQYLVTAKHVVQGISASDTVELYYSSNWHTLAVTVVGEASGGADITVLAPGEQLSPVHLHLAPTSDGITFGQDVYFLGFPYNMFADMGELNRNFPVPFVKRGLVSSWSEDEYGILRWFLDGHNNPGFSGGPIVWTRSGENNYNVAAVVSGYRYEDEPVYAGDEPTSLAYRYNTGIIIAYDIQHATELIQRNPIGLELA